MNQRKAVLWIDGRNRNHTALRKHVAKNGRNLKVRIVDVSSYVSADAGSPRLFTPDGLELSSQESIIGYLDDGDVTTKV